MTSTYKNKRNIRVNGLHQLLSKTSIQIIGDCLFTKLTIQKEKEVRVKIKKRGEFLKNTKEYLGKK